MSNNKQSSIQQFWDKIALKLSVEQINQFLPLFEQTKAMHKEEILGSWGNGWVNGDVDVNRYEDTAEKFYNEEFGGQDA